MKIIIKMAKHKVVCFQQVRTTIIYLHSLSHLVSIQEKYQVALSGCSSVYQTHLFALSNIINHACKTPHTLQRSLCQEAEHD